MKFILVPLIISLAGTALTEEQEPLWLARLRVKCEDTVHRCLGAIITDNFLLTTASCVNKCNDSDRTIKISVSGQKLKATKVIIHPEDPKTQQIHDVALVKFNCPKVQLTKVLLNDDCIPESGLSVINLYDKTSVSTLVSPASLAKKKKCKRAYENWVESQQVCIIASSCSNRSEALITDDAHNILYGFSLYGTVCDSKYENTIIAAMELCEYYTWITNNTDDLEQCTKKSTSLPPHQITFPTGSTQSTTATTATTPTTATTVTTPTKPPGCPEPADIANGDVTYNGLTKGSIAEYSCDPGYVLIGNKRLKCIATGWNGDPPTCEPKNCGTPPKIDNGMVTFTGKHYGSTATYQCNESYAMKGDDTITCEANGKWSKKVPSCKPSKACSNPKPVIKATVDVPDSLTEGAKVKYTCPPRYKLVGDNILTCKNGKWTGVLPHCKDCPEFGAVTGGRVEVHADLTTLLAVEVICQTGYNIKGKSSNHCDRGEWKYPKATCEAVKCPVPKSIPIGSVTTTGLTYGYLAIYSCPKNYLVSGYQKRQCQSDGTWTGTPPKCVLQSEKFCESFGRISCGVTSNRGGLGIGATVTYTPNANAELVGATEITCLPNGKWSAPTPMCRQMCPMTFELENGNHQLMMNDDKPEYGMQMTCDDGFVMIGEKNFICKDGKWTKPPSQTQCVEECKCLKVKNAKVNCIALQKYLMLAYVTCTKGKLTESSPALCRNGEYKVVPKCQ